MSTLSEEARAQPNRLHWRKAGYKVEARGEFALPSAAQAAIDRYYQEYHPEGYGTALVMREVPGTESSMWLVEGSRICELRLMRDFKNFRASGPRAWVLRRARRAARCLHIESPLLPEWEAKMTKEQTQHINGTYCWMLARVEPVGPWSWKGAQGLWDINVDSKLFASAPTYE